MEDLAFITLTNDGYIDYTLNLLKSLEVYNLEKKLKCYCIGDKCYNTLTRKGYRAFLLDDKINTNFCKFRRKNWGEIVSKKFDIITENLKTHKYVLITDGDIVFTNKNAINYLLENIEDNDMIVQSSNKNAICSGFFMLRSNEKTIKLFDPINIEKQKTENKWGDQKYVNEIKHKLKYKRLPNELYPTGAVYYDNFKDINPYIIHFNYVVGNKKKKTMKKYNHLYLNNYKITLEEWQKIKKPINSLLVQGTPTDGKDGWQNWIIGYNWRYMKLNNHKKGEIQIGEHKNLLILGIKDKTDRTRRKKSSVNRLKIIEILKKNNFNNKLHDPNKYFSKLANYKFVVSPEGNGIDCHRHYEALMAGSIPICEYNEKTEKKYEGLPILYTKDYSEINEEYLIKKYNEMLKKEYNFDKMFLYYYTKEQQKEIKRCCKHWCKKHNFESHY